MSTFKIFTAIFLLWAGFGMQGCKDDDVTCNDPTNPKCENYDPCYGKKPVTADFEMSQVFKLEFPKWIDAFNPDVAFMRYDVGFRPVGYTKGDTSYHCTWLLGSEVIIAPVFSRDFSDTKQTGENDIPITLILRRTPDKACFPDDDGIDTVTQYIHFVETPCEFLTNGDFKVLFKGEKDSTIIGIRNWHYIGPPPSFPIDFGCDHGTSDVQYINFDRDSKNPPDTIFSGSKQLQFNSTLYSISSTVANAPFGGKFTINRESLEIKGYYKIARHNGGYSEDEYEFSGRKIK
ncbi:MAG: hypothetical protein H6607_04385 [Flavobacteriales bacterium]|nr:hypothetical protein [Flavobacteriales bacterium]